MKHQELWTMEDGTQIKVSDMSEEHVRNTLCMIIRKQKELKKAVNGAFKIVFDLDVPFSPHDKDYKAFK